MDDIFAPAVKLVPTVGSIVDFLNTNVRCYLANAIILDPNMGVEVKVKKGKKVVTLSPAQRAIFDYGGRWALEKDEAGERMFYYWAPKKDEPEVRMAFFMADKSFRIVGDLDD